MPRKRERPTKRLYLKGGRWYADFRDFADVGGKLEAMVPHAERYATQSRAEALKLGKARHKELRAARRRGPAPSGVDLTKLGDFVDHHLEREASETDRPESGLKQLEQQLETAVAHFGAETKLRAIRTTDIQSYLDRLQRDGLAAETQRKYLTALSKLFRRARAEEVVPVEHNPIAALVNRPKKTPTEREWRSDAGDRETDVVPSFGQVAAFVNQSEKSDPNPRNVRGTTPGGRWMIPSPDVVRTLSVASS